MQPARRGSGTAKSRYMALCVLGSGLQQSHMGMHHDTCACDVRPHQRLTPRWWRTHGRLASPCQPSLSHALKFGQHRKEHPGPCALNSGTPCCFPISCNTPTAAHLICLCWVLYLFLDLHTAMVCKPSSMGSSSMGLGRGMSTVSSGLQYLKLLCQPWLQRSWGQLDALPKVLDGTLWQ